MPTQLSLVGAVEPSCVDPHQGIVVARLRIRLLGHDNVAICDGYGAHAVDSGAAGQNRESVPAQVLVGSLATGHGQDQ